MSPNLSTLRPLIAGDIIIDIKPIVHIIYNEMKDKYCDNCIEKSSQLKKCSKCHQMSYCDKNCQTIDWKYHKNECKVLRNKKFKPNEVLWFERLLIRLWVSDQSFANKRLPLMDGTDISLDDIQLNLEELSKDEKFMSVFELICIHFKDYRIGFVRKHLLHWFGLITSSPIRQEFMSYCSYTGGPIDPNVIPIVGMGLYPQLYAVNHSCLPNSIVVLNGLSLQLRAIEPIAIGTQITRSFVYLAQNKLERHKYLKLKYLINGCNCIKCQQNTDSKVDYQKLDSLFEKQSKEIIDSMGNPLNLKKFVSEMSELTEIAIKAMGKYDTKLTEILITEIIFRQFCGLCRQGVVGDEYYRRLEDHIRITYGVLHPIYIQTHKDNPFFRLTTN